jgi:hypothetical protein
MNRIERSVLSASIKAIREHNRNLWWELKRQIWDGGFQAYYPRQGEYEIPTRQVLNRIDLRSFSLLEQEWSKAHPGERPHRDVVLRHYEAAIIEELVRRATIAAYQTNEW